MLNSKLLCKIPWTVPLEVIISHIFACNIYGYNMDYIREKFHPKTRAEQEVFFISVDIV